MQPEQSIAVQAVHVTAQPTLYRPHSIIALIIALISSHLPLQFASPVVFPSERNQNRAVQAVHVTAQPTLYPPQPSEGPETRASSGANGPARDGSSSGGDQADISGQGGVELVGGMPAGQSRAQSRSSSGSSSQPRVHTFTFCLERVDEGALKGIWYTVGVRVGDYSV